MSPMTLRDVLFVPGLKKNLISISMIKDRGLGVSSWMDMCVFFPRLQDHLPLTPLELDVGNCKSSCFNPIML